MTRTAEAVYAGFDGDGRLAARGLLLRMVSPGEGTVDTRRRVTVTELTGATTLTELAGPAKTPQAATNQAVLTDLIQTRLVTADTDTSGTETVQISHEALLSAWPRLRLWLSQDRAGYRIHRDLTDAAHAWQAEDREPSRLFVGTRLAVTGEWADSHEQDLNADERAFLAACWRRERRGTWLRRSAVAALAMLMLLSAGAARVAFQKSSQALSERNHAIANQVVAESELLQSTNPSRARQLDLVAHRLNPTPDNTSQLLATTNTPLADPLTGANLPSRRWRTARTDTPWPPATVSPSGCGTPPTPAMPPRSDSPSQGPPPASPRWRSARTDTFSLPEPSATPYACGTSPIRPMSLGSAVPAGPSNGSVQSVAFSPNGRTLAVGNINGTLGLWDVANPAHVTQIAPQIIPAISGRLLRGVQPGRPHPGLRRWFHGLAVERHRSRHAIQIGQPLTGTTGTVRSVAFSPDGHILAVGSSDSVIRLWNLTNPVHATQIGQPLTGLTRSVTSVAFSPDGRILAAGSDDHMIRLWNVTNPAHATQVGQPLLGPALGVASVAFSPDGHTLAVGYGSFGAEIDEGAVWMWSLPSTILTGLAGSVTSVAFSPDGHTLAADSDNGTIRLWNLINPASPTAIGHTLTGPTTGLGNSVTFSPAEHMLGAGRHRQHHPAVERHQPSPRQ